METQLSQKKIDIPVLILCYDRPDLLTILLKILKKYNYKINDIKKIKKNQNFKKNVPYFWGQLYWLSLFKEFNEGKHVTWDYTIVHDCLTKNLKCIKPSFNMIANIGYRDKNLLDKRKRYEISSFDHLKNKKNDYKYEKNYESWFLYSLSLRYRLSLF
jgi:hypothetical protein